jgi:putative FmdB family regulatory protein
MPVYEYHCDKCGKNFDLFVRSATRESEPKCPQCGSSEVKKAISLFGVGGTSGRQDFGASCGPGPI